MLACPERSKLHSDANAILARIIDLLQQQREALSQRDHQKLMALDKQLEMEIGNKERTFGALQQHIKEHGC